MTTLKRIEKSFFYRNCIVIEKDNKNNGDLLTYFIDRLVENGFDIQQVKIDDNLFLLLSVIDEKKILLEAQFRKVRVNTKLEIKENSDFKKQLLIEENKRQYSTLSHEIFTTDEIYKNFYNLIDIKKDERWGLDLFTESEMLYLETSILKEIRIDSNEFKKIVLNSNLINEKDEKFSKEHVLKFLDSENRLFYIYEELNLFKEIFAVHTSNFKEYVSDDKLTKVKVKGDYNVHIDRSYFGDYVSIYFYWLDHYTSKLTFILI